MLASVKEDRMPQLRVTLTDQTFERLALLASRERRPIPWQAEHLIERAVRHTAVSCPKSDSTASDNAPDPRGEWPDAT